MVMAVMVPLDLLEKPTFQSPWWLAGGISAEWVPKVFTKTHPWGIDASSQLELSPGIKDLTRVKALLKAILKAILKTIIPLILLQKG